MTPWTEVELNRWVMAIRDAALECESIAESDFYDCWIDDLENSPPANKVDV